MRNRVHGHLNDVFRDNRTRLNPRNIKSTSFCIFASVALVKTVTFLGTKWMNRTLRQVFLSGEAETPHSCCHGKGLCEDGVTLLVPNNPLPRSNPNRRNRQRVSDKLQAAATVHSG